MPKKSRSKAEQRADAVMDLFEKDAARGGRVAHHLLQCALQAMEALSDLPVIVGALLHNINALQHANMQPAAASAAHLRALGFSDRVCAIASLQPEAERYLARTLPAADAEALELRPFFNDALAVCRWAAQAHTTNIEALPLSFFRRLVWDHLSCRLA